MNCRLKRILKILCGDDDVRVVFALGKIVEQSGPVAKTLQHLGPKPSKRNLLMAFEMSDSQETIVTPKFLSRKGNPAPVDGVPEWSTDNTDVLALMPAPDGKSCKISAAGPLGVGTVTLKADADMGAGVVDVIGTLEVTITGGQAAVVTLDPGAPTEQP